MTWHMIAGVAQLVLIAVVAANHLRARRPVGELLVIGVPMAVLAVGTLAGYRWAVVVAAVFYSVWLINEVFSFVRPNRARRNRRRPLPRGAHLVLGAVSIVVLALTWLAVVPAGPVSLS